MLKKIVLSLKEKNLFSIFFSFLFLLILINSGIDKYFKIETEFYSFKLSYFIISIFICFFIFQLIFNSKKALEDINLLIKKKEKLFFCLFLTIGLLSTLTTSVYMKRSFFMLLWSTLIILGLPIVFLKIRSFISFNLVYKITVIYLLIQACILILDFFLSNQNWSNPFHIAHVMKDPGSQLYRPHAFKQEPSYYAAYALLQLCFIRFFLKKIKQELLWFNLARITIFFLVFSILFSLSKMGIIGIVFWIFIESIKIFSLNSFQEIKNFIKKLSNLKKVFILIFLVFFTILTITKLPKMKVFFNPLFRKTTIQKEGALHGRFVSFIKGIKVFKESYFLGVGPGTAKAYYLKNFYIEFKAQEKGTLKKSYINKPLSLNLYTELLSEWGLLGTLFFIFGILFLFKDFKVIEKTQLIGTLGIIYLACESLPRLSIWFSLYLIASSKTSLRINKN